jgi:hypothetical protein
MFEIKNKSSNNKNSKTRQEIQDKKQFLKEKFEFEQKFYRLMLELGLYNKFNKTYWLRIINKTEYGFYAQLYLVDGLNFSELKQKISNIQESLCCIWIMRTRQFQNYADIKIVIKPINEKLPYQNPEIKPWEMYLGLSFTLNPIKVNMNKYCMFLLSGATGSGKTTLMYQILLSYILICQVCQFRAAPAKTRKAVQRTAINYCTALFRSSINSSAFILYLRAACSTVI